MLRFECDYNEGCLPQILELMVKSNMEQHIGYGEDAYCEEARRLIKEVCKTPDADVHFLVGGTQTNKTVIQSYLKSYQGVLSAETGHINTHETGTVEAGGHKVLPLSSPDGKINAKQVDDAMIAHGGDCHCVQPAMVYISNPTEYGTIYTKAELEDLRKVCDKWNLPLFLDGARMGYALYALGNDVMMEDYGKYCDVFYIGGTKVGALFGEAVVIVNENMKKDFRYNIKQNGGMLAKGRLLGIQFIPLFGEEKLYFKVSENRIKLAMKLKDCFTELGWQFAYDSPTNQQFIKMPNDLLAKISEKYAVSRQGAMDENHTLVRFCTSWATKEENVDKLIADLKEICR